MSVTLDASAYASKGSKEFQKHYGAVKFCIENDLSFPVETSEFFKGKIQGYDLEDIEFDETLKILENGLEIDMPFRRFRDSELHIKVEEIPSSVDLIIVKLA